MLEHRLQAGAVAVRKDLPQHVEGRRVPVREWAYGIGKGQVALRHVFLDDLQALLPAGRLRLRLRTLRLGARPRKAALQDGKHGLFVEITHRHDGHPLRPVVASEIGKDVAPADGGDRFGVADDGPAVRVAGVAREEKLVEELPLRVVLAHLYLFQHDLFLFFQLFLGKGRMRHGIDKEPQAPFEGVARDDDVIDRIVVRRERVDGAAHRLDLRGDLVAERRRPSL